MKTSDLPAMGVSLGAHVVILAGLFLIKLTVIDPATQLDLETVFEPERTFFVDAPWPGNIIRIGQPNVAATMIGEIKIVVA